MCIRPMRKTPVVVLNISINLKRIENNVLKDVLNILSTNEVNTTYYQQCKKIIIFYFAQS